MKINIALAGTPPHTSEVFIGGDVMESIARGLETSLGGRSAYWIWDETVWPLWERRVRELGWPTQSGWTRFTVYSLGTQ